MTGLLLAYTVLGMFVMDRWQHRSGQTLSQLGFGYSALIEAI